MPRITCSAKSCAYNRDRTCGLPDVHVSGAEARRPAATSCADFCTDGRCVAPHPEAFARVACTAGECRHNGGGRCEAGAIDIGGSAAVCSGETECDTFIRR
ncbi:MAG: DUF1540 domain-containing protein [Clostridia bacterium]|nr:DUF1540 domain-containing protein [Clostridia bacterium]